MSDEVRAIDPESARKLLVDLRERRWSWRREDLPAVAEALGWTNFEILDGDLGATAFADAPITFGGEEVEALIRDGIVEEVSIQISDQPAKKTDESLASLHRSWTCLVDLTTALFGPPTLRTPSPNPDAQWRGEEATIRIVNAKAALVLVWARNAYQDNWNSQRARE